MLDGNFKHIFHKICDDIQTDTYINKGELSAVMGLRFRQLRYVQIYILIILQ